MPENLFLYNKICKREIKFYQIKIFKQFKGTEEEMVALSATCIGSHSLGYVYNSGANSYAKVNFTFSWSGVPFVSGTDVVAMTWEQNYYLDPNKPSKLVNKYNVTSDGGSYVTRTYSTTYDSVPNYAVKFEFPVRPIASQYIKSGSGTVYFYRPNTVKIF